MVIGKKRRGSRTVADRARREISMSSISSWMRQLGIDRLIGAVAAGCLMTTVVLAETADIRLGPRFRDAAGYPMARFGSLAEVLLRVNLGARLFVRKAENCQNLLTIPPGRWRG